MRMLLALVLVLGGCAVYPTSRTFYEPEVADGKPENRASCGYINTRDSVRRVVDGIEISISPADENISDPAPGDLKTFFGFTLRSAGVDVDPSKIKVAAEDGRLYQGRVLQHDTRPTRRLDGNYTWTIVRLVFPEPAGRSSKLTYVFEPGSVTLDGRQVAISPFRFTRVTKSDVYYGSINC